MTLSYLYLLCCVSTLCFLFICETMGDSDTEEMPHNSTETESFNFDEWATGLGLSRKVTQILRQEELTSKTALKLIKLKDLKELGLPLGSVKIIENEIHIWNKGQNTSDKLGNSEKDMNINAEILAWAGKTLDVLLNDQLLLSDNPTCKPVLFGQMDPRTILTLKSQTNKAVHITQFLTEKCKRRRQGRRKEFVLKSGSANSETLVLKADEEHPYLGIFIEEWGAANMRLLNHLLATQKLRRNDIEFYLAYTTKIFEFAEKYEWNSVLNYDYAYRELQAEHQFQWEPFHLTWNYSYLSQSALVRVRILPLSRTYHLKTASYLRLGVHALSEAHVNIAIWKQKHLMSRCPSPKDQKTCNGPLYSIKLRSLGGGASTGPPASWILTLRNKKWLSHRWSRQHKRIRWNG